MSRVIKCVGKTAATGGKDYEIWINPDRIIAYSDVAKGKNMTVLWIGGGEEDFIMIAGSLDSTITRFGFNNGGG